MDNIQGYKIKKLIGRGPNGEVYLVEKNNKDYALKKVINNNLEDIENEINILKSLDNKFICKYYDFFKDNEYYYIIMEYYEHNLRTLMRDYREYNKYAEFIKTILFQICLGIKYIHEKNIIHRNLKPENIFIDNNKIIKIGDFGILKKFNKDRYTNRDVRTFNYMAPEIIKNEKYNNKVDLWSYGCIIYELITFERCFEDKKINGLFDKIINQNHKNIKIKKKDKYRRFLDDIDDINDIYDRDDIDGLFKNAQ